MTLTLGQSDDLSRTHSVPTIFVDREVSSALTVLNSNVVQLRRKATSYYTSAS